MTVGYDLLGVNRGLVLDLQMREFTGTLIHDYSEVHHEDVAAVNTPTWTNYAPSGMSFLDFDAASREYLNLPAADSADLNFTSGSFSGVAWVNTNVTGNRYIFCKAVAGWATGWAFYLPAGGAGVVWISFATLQAGADQYSSSADGIMAIGSWHLVGFSRDGASARLYIDGTDYTVTPGTHIDPDSAAAADFVIGATQAGAAGWWDGYIWRPRIWDRALRADEHKAIYGFESQLWP